MRDLGKIVLHIPAREGSKRVPRKNMRSMNGKPMITYVIDAALKASVTENVYVNTDAPEIIEYIEKTYPSVKLYKRDPELANDKASSDQFNFDIINALQPDTLIMINPVCPLIDENDIKKAVDMYMKSDCDTLITSESTQMQTFCDGKPVNIRLDEQLAPSQENGRITILNWAITIWEVSSFKQRMQEKGFAVLGEKREFLDIEPIKATKVSEEKDFLFAEQLLKVGV
jgi:CMP-N-acetylneuraminic acid synthetase